MLAGMREGLHFVFSHPILRAFAATSVICNFFVDVHLAVFVLYAVRELEFSPMIIGGMYAAGSAGGLLGSVFADRLVKRLGLGRVIVGAQVFVTLAMLAIPLSGSRPGISIAVIALAEAVWGFSVVVYVVNTVSLRQGITPDRLQGRAAASLRFVTWGVAPLGFLLGGALGEWIGLRAALLIAVFGPALSVIWLLLSPVPKLRSLPTAEREPRETTLAEQVAPEKAESEL
jgi:MFS family permease